MMLVAYHWLLDVCCLVVIVAEPIVLIGRRFLVSTRSLAVTITIIMFVLCCSIYCIWSSGETIVIVITTIIIIICCCGIIILLLTIAAAACSLHVTITIYWLLRPVAGARC